ncbi:MAG TPA: hypothetical protein PL112_05655, partial [Candidatus Obscuribacter sp.]|nr:hypothetical protein [Candidatus Obscuribacter sp.]
QLGLECTLTNSWKTAFLGNSPVLRAKQPYFVFFISFKRGVRLILPRVQEGRWFQQRFPVLPVSAFII